MFGNLTGIHLVLILVVLLLLFGAAKLPALAKNVGASAKILKSEMRSMHDESAVVLPVVAEAAPTHPAATDRAAQV